MGEYSLYCGDKLVAKSNEYGITNLVENWCDNCESKQPILTVKYDRLDNIENTKAFIRHGNQTNKVNLNEKNNLVIDIQYIMANKLMRNEYTIYLRYSP